uniref:Anoctamin n=1 Tax=Mesocestoides corti TaxID=53468 RepID=A0A5K3FCM7_MESCO
MAGDKECRMFFADGVRRTDYVIAFTLPPKCLKLQDDFFSSLLDYGIEIEMENCDGQIFDFKDAASVGVLGEKGVGIARLHITWTQLLRVAEVLRFQKPVVFDEYFFISFGVDRIKTFKSISNEEDFFSPLERTEAIEYILRRVTVQPHATSDSDHNTLLPSAGVYEHLRNTVFLAAFPLHEPEIPGGLRSRLIANWASCSSLLNKQPLDDIRAYFGERVAFCFAWTQFYMWCFLGIFLVSFGVAIIPSILPNSPHSIISEICAPNATTYIMCPSCSVKGCRFRKLSDACGDLSLIYFFDNPISTFLAFIAPILGTLCLNLWIYEQSKLQHRWHVQDYRITDEPPRQEFLARLHGKPSSSTIHRSYWRFTAPVHAVTYLITCLLIGLTVALTFTTMYVGYRLEIYFLQCANEFCNKHATYLAFAVDHTLNAVGICALSWIYKTWAEKSTSFECHRTQSQHDRSLMLKLFFLEFINVYLSLLSAVVIRAVNVSFPGQSHAMFEPPEWPVWTGLFAIFYEVYIECTVIVVVKGIRQWLPRDWWTRLRRKIGPSGQVPVPGNSGSPAYRHCLDNLALCSPDARPLFQQYLYMCLFIGFAVMFLPASFPWIISLLLFATLTVRGLAMKLTRTMHRLVAHRARSIGIWTQVLKGLTAFSILTNACLIAFSSEFVNKLVYQFHYSPDGSLRGYTEFTLSYMDIDSFEIADEDRSLLNGARVCRYFGYREPPTSEKPYHLTSVFWHILAAKFIFIFVFAVSVIFINWLLSCIIPRTAANSKKAREAESRMAKAMIFNRSSFNQ